MKWIVVRCRRQVVQVDHLLQTYRRAHPASSVIVVDIYTCQFVATKHEHELSSSSSLCQDGLCAIHEVHPSDTNLGLLLLSPRANIQLPLWAHNNELHKVSALDSHPLANLSEYISKLSTTLDLPVWHVSISVHWENFNLAKVNTDSGVRGGTSITLFPHTTLACPCNGSLEKSICTRVCLGRSELEIILVHSKYDSPSL